MVETTLPDEIQDLKLGVVTSDRRKWQNEQKVNLCKAYGHKLGILNFQEIV